ncbi:MAG: response regulator [Mariprofundaceae bacterium]|nr:response regulator [Mariprofundaceae bacterium]
MILFVDDDEEILGLYSSFLKQQGYRVLPCSSPIQALGVFQQHQSNIRTVISDYCMPEMNGLELMRMLQSHTPSIQKIMITGYCFDEIPTNISLIQKPFSIRHLLQVVNERDEKSIPVKDGYFQVA